LLDIKTELKKFNRINLVELTRGNDKIPEKIRNSVFLYNKAIESIKSGSEDIAVIELKKAISLNPQFYEAMNLLGVCYSYLGETDKSAEMFERVVKAESNSIIAMNYMKRLGMVEVVPPPKGKQSKEAGGTREETLKRVRTEKKPLYGINKRRSAYIKATKLIASFVAGAALTAIIFLSLSNTQTQPPADSDNNMEAVYQEEINNHIEKYNELKEKYSTLEQDKKAAVEQADYYKAVNRLYEIDALHRSGEFEKAADMLLLMKTVEFKDDDIEKFNNLVKTVMPKAAKAAYDYGYRQYNSRNYQEALKSFEKVEMYDADYPRMDAVYYFMGRSCQLLQDSRSAVAFYQKLLENYPKSGYLKSAKARINELTKNP
jgi:tetratricopeptide (TPR) repeat protein